MQKQLPGHGTATAAPTDTVFVLQDICKSYGQTQASTIRPGLQFMAGTVRGLVRERAVRADRNSQRF